MRLSHKNRNIKFIDHPYFSHLTEVIYRSGMARCESSGSDYIISANKGGFLHYRNILGAALAMISIAKVVKGSISTVCKPT